MPHQWGNILVVTKDELVPKYYNCLKSLQTQIGRYKDKPYGIKKVQSGGNGRQLLVDFDSLPKEIQNSIGDPRTMHHPLLKFWEINPAATAFYTTYEFEDGDYLKIEYQEEYITNASVLIALLKLKEERLSLKGGKKTGIMESLRIDLITFNEYLPKVHGRTHTLELGDRQFSRVFKEMKRTLISEV